MAAEEQSDKMASEMEVCMKQREGGIGFFHVEKMAHIDIHCCLLNVYGDQRVDVSTVRRWVVHFSSSNSNIGLPPQVQIFTSAGSCSLLAKMQS